MEDSITTIGLENNKIVIICSTSKEAEILYESLFKMLLNLPENIKAKELYDKTTEELTKGSYAGLE